MITDLNLCAVVGLAVFFGMLFYVGHVLGKQPWYTRIHNYTIYYGMKQPFRLTVGIFGVVIGGLSVGVVMFVLETLGITRGCF